MNNTFTAAVLLIGDEILSGSIQDENLSHIAIMLEKVGIRVRDVRVVPDLEGEIVDAVNQLRGKYHYIFTTGGIGPTHDDITSDSIAKAFNVKNVIQQDIFDEFQAYLDSKGIEFTKAAQRMAHAPEGAEMIKTKQAALPGYRIENVFVMAGVPRIMRVMLDAIIPKLEAGKPILNGSVHANVREGAIAKDLETIQQAHSEVVIGSYPQEINSKRSNYSLILVVKGIDQNEIDLVCKKILKACLDGGYEANYPSN